jgi:hypothetical protein
MLLPGGACHRRPKAGLQTTSMGHLPPIYQPRTAITFSGRA